MRNLYLLPVLLAGTFLSSSALAGDYQLTADQLNAATDRFTWNSLNNDEYIENSIYVPSHDNPGTSVVFGYTYSKPVDYALVEGTWTEDIASKTVYHNAVLYNEADLFATDIASDFVNVTLVNSGTLGIINGDFVWTRDYPTILNANQGSREVVSIAGINGNIIGTSGLANAIDEYNRTYGARAEIGNINSTLIAGNIGVYGPNAYVGAIENYNGTIGNITAEKIINNAAIDGGNPFMVEASVQPGTYSVAPLQAAPTMAHGGFLSNEGEINFYYEPQYATGYYCWNCPSSADHVAPPATQLVESTPIDNPETYSAVVGNISGDIIGNMAMADYASGGAIYNYYGQIGDISGNILGNFVSVYNSPFAVLDDQLIDVIRPTEDVLDTSYLTHTGGAIYNENGKIGTITSPEIKDNYAEGSTAAGGAIYNQVFLESDTQPIVQEYAVPGDAETKNAVLLMDVYAERMNIEGSTFENNYAHSIEGNAYGGAIDNEFFLQNRVSEWEDYLNYESEYLERGYVYMTDEELQQKVIDAKANAALTLTNANFINNHVDSDSGRAFGGAIYSTGDVNVIANAGKTSLFSGNTANGESNAIYMKASTQETYYVFCDELNQFLPSNLNLTAVSNGVIQFDDVIDGDGYNINVSGDGTGVVKFNNLVKNVTNFTLGANSITHLGLNSKVYAQNMIIDGSAIIHTSAASSPIITVDVEVDKDNNTIHTGQIFVDDDIDGSYRVLVNSLNPDVLDNTENAVVPFLFAPNDDTDTSSSFAVARVIGSPYMWDGSVNAGGETDGSTWYLNLTEDENPEYNPDDPQPQPGKIYAPEVVAGIGLHEAAIEQTRSVVHNIKGKVAAGREFCPRCGMYDYGWDNNLLRNVWVLAQGESANIEEPVDMEAKIYAVEGGFDIQNDIHNTLGVFASYRTGEYDLSGKGKKFRSNLGSEIDIDSYLAGLYYRYDRYLVWAFATIYGGVQQADVKTDDGMAKFDTDGIEFGASIEVGRTIPLAKDLMLDPSVGLYYTQVNFDDADDNVGKHYKWDDIKHLEAELGAKLEKQFDNAKVYVKPSVIRTFTNGDSVTISGMNKAGTYSDQTLGRIEIGGRYGFTDALSGYAWANYTFGSSYDAYALGAGMSYAW